MTAAKLSLNEPNPLSPLHDPSKNYQNKFYYRKKKRKLFEYKNHFQQLILMNFLLKNKYLLNHP